MNEFRFICARLILDERVLKILSVTERHTLRCCSVIPKDQNKLFVHDKNRKGVELWVRTNLYNVP